MNNDHADEDARADALGEFLEELESSADPNALVQHYSAKHPQWSADFAEEATLTRLLVTSREGYGLPDLDQLPDFKIVRWVATGGMGIVYEAIQQSLNRRVALKVRYGRPSAERQMRFQREQQALARLHQSHIVPIHVSGDCDGWQYFAMAFIEGASLHHVVKAALEHARTSDEPMPTVPELVQRSLAPTPDGAGAAPATKWSASEIEAAKRTTAPPSDAAATKRPLVLSAAYFRSVARLMADAADALDFAHSVGVVHRDLKPSNIMVDQSGHCWLIDFGLAHCAGIVEPLQRDFNCENGADGRTVGPMGTPEYMAPEQHQTTGNATSDARTDVWGIGATMFELLTLCRPFQGTTFQEIKQKVLLENPAPTELLVRNLPEDLAAICRKAMRKEIADRYQRAEDLSADLRRWLNGEPTAARPAALARSIWMWACRNRGWAVGLTASFLFSAAVVASIFIYLQSEARESTLRASAAEDNARLQRREVLLQQAQRIKQSRANNGWSDEAWELIRQASEIERDDRLRDAAVATLLGLDARIIKRWALPGSSVAFDDAGKRLLIGGTDRHSAIPAAPARLWSSEKDHEQQSTLPGEGPVGFDVEGNPLQLVLQKDQRRLLLWDVVRGKAVREFPLPVKEEAAGDAVFGVSNPVTHVAYSWHKRTFVWHVSSAKVIADFPFAVDALAFSRDGEFVALAESGKSRVVVWSLPKQESMAELPLGNLQATCIAFGKRRFRSNELPSKYLAIGDAGGTIAIWDLATRLPISYCRGSARSIAALEFSPDETLLASGGREDARLWNVASGELALRLRDARGMDFITGVAFSRDGRRLAVSSRGIFYTPGVTVWELSPGRGLNHLVGLSGQVESIVFSPDGRKLAALAQNWEIGLWDLETGQLQAKVDVPAGVHADNAGLAFSSDGRKLAYSVGAPLKGEARLWETEKLKELERWSLSPGLQNKLVFDRDNALWLFQVELKNGQYLPDSAFDWRLHPRVCRIRNLSADDPQMVHAEITDFNRHVYLAVAASDGQHVAVEGKGGPAGEHRWAKIIALKTGEIIWSQSLHRQTPSGSLSLEPSGNVVYYAPTDTLPMIGISIPEGKAIGRIHLWPHAVADGARYLGVIHNGPTRKCSIHRRNEAMSFVNLLPDSGVGTLVFDRARDRLAWGSTEGAIVVCDLAEAQRRLKHLGLEW
jgi:serine/threonine protein kinase/WD40 repeat protein